MVEYVCDACGAIFDVGKYSLVQRCPECLEWEAHPVEEPRDGEIFAAWSDDT